MKVFELLKSADSKLADIYWAVLTNNKVVTVPKKSNSLNKDFFDFGTDRSISGAVLVNVDKKAILLDLAKYNGADERRPASKIANFNHNAKHAYPILGGSISFKNVGVLTKFLKFLVAADPRTRDFELVGDDRFEGTAAKFLDDKHEDASDIFKPNVKAITLYHGTSQKVAKKILKSGFKTGQRAEAYADLLKGYSENNIYLTFYPSTAANYATREAINDGSDAVILKVTLNAEQILKLRADEDNMHWFSALPKGWYDSLIHKHPILAKIWGKEKNAFQAHISNLNHAEGKFGLAWLIRGDTSDKEFGEQAQAALTNAGYGTIEKVEALEQNVYRDLMKAFVDGSIKASVKSGAIAYPGNIKASQISTFKTWSIKETKIKRDGYDRSEYDDAYDKQAASVKK